MRTSIRRAPFPAKSFFPRSNLLNAAFQVKFFETSAKSNINVEIAFMTIAKDVMHRIIGGDGAGGPKPDESVVRIPSPAPFGFFPPFLSQFTFIYLCFRVIICICPLFVPAPTPYISELCHLYFFPHLALPPSHHQRVDDKAAAGGKKGCC